MAKWWQFWRDDKAPGGGKGQPKPTGGKAGSGRVADAPKGANAKKSTTPKGKRGFDGRAK